MVWVMKTLSRGSVMSRFPADSGILAEQTAKTLNVQFLEKIFMKSATSYKSAVYTGASPSDFWEGREP